MCALSRWRVAGRAFGPPAVVRLVTGPALAIPHERDLRRVTVAARYAGAFGDVRRVPEGDAARARRVGNFELERKRHRALSTERA